MAVAHQTVTDICRAAKAGARTLAVLDSGTKDRALLAIADALEARTPEILEANARDLEAGREAALSSALMDPLALVAGGGRDELAELATQEGVVDLIIPRGGEGLKAALSAVAKVPVIYAASGNCHVYVDASADLDAAREIAVNAKVQRPGVCNAAETLLVHADVAAEFLPGVLATLRDAGVDLRGDERVRALDSSVAEATEEDW